MESVLLHRFWAAQPVTGIQQKRWSGSHSDWEEPTLIIPKASSTADQQCGRLWRTRCRCRRLRKSAMASRHKGVDKCSIDTGNLKDTPRLVWSSNTFHIIHETLTALRLWLSNYKRFKSPTQEHGVTSGLYTRCALFSSQLCYDVRTVKMEHV